MIHDQVYGAIVHALLIVQAPAVPSMSPESTTPTAPTADSSDILPYIISGILGVLGLAVTVFTTVYTRRRNSNSSADDNDEEDRPQLSPDHEYRRLLRKLGAVELYLALRNIDIRKIKSGRETDAQVKSSSS